MQTAFRKAPPTLILRHQLIEHLIDRLTGVTGQWDLGSRLQQGNKLVQLRIRDYWSSVYEHFTWTESVPHARDPDCNRL